MKVFSQWLVGFMFKIFYIFYLKPAPRFFLLSVIKNSNYNSKI